MAYRLLGTSTTNANGQATYTYTGVGAGEIDIVASLDNPITQGSLVSVPCTVTDCAMYDKGILNDSDTHDIYTNKQSNLDFQRTSEYSTIKSTNTSYASMRISNIPSSCVVDMDVCQVGGTVSDQIFGILVDTTWKTSFTLGWVGYTESDLGNWIKLRFTFRDGSATLESRDDLSKTYTRVFTGSPNALMISTANADDEIRFKNVKVYPEEQIGHIRNDNCTSNSHTDIWNVSNTNLNFTRETEYSSIKRISSDTYSILWLESIPNGATLDFEIKQVGGANNIGLFSCYHDTTYKTYFTLNSLGSVGTWLRLRVTFNTDSITITNRDDSSKTQTNTISGVASRFGFQNTNAITELQIKNVHLH